MNYIDTIIFGIVEGITEFLPISSTAHLDIVREFLNIEATSFVKSFEIAIQLGAILSVVLLYQKRLRSNFKIIRNIVIAFIPTGVIGFLLYEIIKSVFLGNTLLASTMLILGGIVIVLFERKRRDLSVSNDRDLESLTTKELLILGTVQALAVVPGVSRSGAVIISGRALGLNAKLITEFSFLLAIPTMLAATAYDLLKSGFSFSKDEWGLMALGFIVSFFVAIFVVRWLILYIQRHSFSVFGWYRIVFGILVTILFVF
jgi:undecaprenyl-diphosphatase